MVAEEPALTRPVDPDDIGKYAKFDGTDVVWDTPAGGSGGGTPGLVGDLSAIEIGDAATAGATGRYADAAHQHALAAPATPAALGASAATGAATAPARADHVHPYPTAAQVGAATSGHAHSGVYDPAGTAAALVAAHDAGTSVHGIADTLALVTLTGSQTLTNKTLTTPVLTLEQGASVAPTAEGRIAWDTDDNQLKVGDGTGTAAIPKITVGTSQPSSPAVGDLWGDTN